MTQRHISASHKIKSCVAGGLFVIGCCAAPNAETGDEFPNKWVVILDGNDFISFRVVSEFGSTNFDSHHGTWSGIADTQWTPLLELERFAKEHFMSKGTFVYLLRVNEHDDQRNITSEVLGKLGVICVGPRETLRQQILTGQRAKWIIDNLPTHDSDS